MEDGAPDGSLRVHARLKRSRKPLGNLVPVCSSKLNKKRGYRHVCFRAGVVVRQQLEQQRFFPVWARLAMVQGKQHEYYSLDLACTTEVRSARNRWRVNYDSETQTWKGDDTHETHT
jgi:hypothetical protein